MTTPLSLESVRQQIAALAGVSDDEVTDDVNLMDVGLDSMRAMRLVQQWIDAGIPVDFAELAEVPTLRHWWTVLSRYAGPDTR